MSFVYTCLEWHNGRMSIRIRKESKRCNQWQSWSGAAHRRNILARSIFLLISLFSSFNSLFSCFKLLISSCNFLFSFRSTGCIIFAHDLQLLLSHTSTRHLSQRTFKFSQSSHECTPFTPSFSEHSAQHLILHQSHSMQSLQLTHQLLPQVRHASSERQELQKVLEQWGLAHIFWGKQLSSQYILSQSLPHSTMVEHFEQ